jgi:hypothetical protein
MKNNEVPMMYPVPKIGGEFVKLKNGQIVRWKSFDDKRTLMLEVELADGKIARVHRRDVDVPTANEELNFLKSQNPRQKTD